MSRAEAGPPQGTPQQPGLITEHERREVVSGNGRAFLVVESYTGPEPSVPQSPTPSHSKAPSEDDVQTVPFTGQRSLLSVATLCNSAIGAGVLSMPFAFYQAGALGGVLMCLVIGAAEGFTLYVLSKMAERYNCSSYASLVRATLGKKTATFLAILMNIYMWGACNAYLVIVGDVFSILGEYVAGPGSLLANRHVIIGTLGVFLMLPLCFMRRLGALSALSSIAVLGFLYTTACILYQGYTVAMSREDPWEGVELLHLDLRAMFALPIIVFGFNCHANAVPIFHELTDVPDKLLPVRSRRKTVKLVNMIAVILAAMMLIMTGYIVVGLAGYVAHPKQISSNVLNVLPTDQVYAQLARLFIGIVVAGHYPLNHHPARQGTLDLAALLGVSEYAREVLVAPIFTLVFVLTSTAVSLFVTDLGDVIHIIGGTTAAFLIFFNPGFMLINAAVVKHSSGMLSSLSEQDLSSQEAAGLSVPLLQAAATKGIKKAGIVYSPGRSWLVGMLLVTLSTFIFVITIYTTFVH